MKERKIEVFLGKCFVGTLAETADRRVAFAYSDEWLDSGFAVSPFSLPVISEPEGRPDVSILGSFVVSFV